MNCSKTGRFSGSGSATFLRRLRIWVRTRCLLVTAGMARFHPLFQDCHGGQVRAGQLKNEKGVGSLFDFPFLPRSTVEKTPDPFFNWPPSVAEPRIRQDSVGSSSAAPSAEPAALGVAGRPRASLIRRVISMLFLTPSSFTNWTTGVNRVSIRLASLD